MHSGNIQLKGPNVVPACEACGYTTRLVGLEPSLGGSGEIATYQCTSCANVQVQPRARIIAQG